MLLRHITSIIILSTLLSSCDTSEDVISLPNNANDAIINFDEWAKERGMQLTAELSKFTVAESENCEFSFDCASKSIMLSNDDYFYHNEMMIYQALAECLLNRQKEDLVLHNDLPTSMMQVDYDPCGNYQCSQTIPFFGGYQLYYIDEIFDNSIDIASYDIFDLPSLDMVPYDLLEFDDCNGVGTDQAVSKLLITYMVEPIEVTDTITFNSMLSSGDNGELPSVIVRLLYPPTVCEYLTGELILDNLFSKSYYHFGILHNDIHTLMNEGFSISYYFTEESLSILVNNNVVKRINLEIDNLKDINSWVTTNQAQPFSDNCDLFNAGSYFE